MIDGLVITGGEPMLQKDIVEFAKKVKELGYFVKLDTNGTFPDKLEKAIEEGVVDYVAMDVKNSFAKYAMTVGLPSFDTAPVAASMKLLQEGRVDYEFRTTVVKELHEKKDFCEIGQLLTSADKYYLQSFVDSKDIIGTCLTPPSREELEIYLNCLKTYINNVSIRDR
jgi:Pyruvate-formate lyase-activating enzyme